MEGPSYFFFWFSGFPINLWKDKCGSCFFIAIEIFVTWLLQLQFQFLLLLLYDIITQGEGGGTKIDHCQSFNDSKHQQRFP